MTVTAQKLSQLDDRLDRLVNIDIGNRGVEHLYQAARAQQQGSLVGAAADALLAVPEGGTVIVTTGSVSRAWISPEIGENDGPSGAAAIVRALGLSRHATCILLAEQALLKPIEAVTTVAGACAVPLEAAHIAAQDKSQLTVVMQAYPTEDDQGKAKAVELLDTLSPDLLFSTERVGRNENGIYYNMRGRDYGMGRARIDYLFDEALNWKIPVVAVGDGGNEIGMGKVADAVQTHVPYGARGDCPCGGGIGAVTSADVLVTAAVSNWGCTAIAAAMAARTGDSRLLHTPESEGRLIETMVSQGLINSTHGIVDPNVDGIAKTTHIAVAELCQSIVGGVLD